MTFSYSRLTAYDSCKYKWLMKYILEVPQTGQSFFSSYGSFAHDILAKFHRGEGDANALAAYYLENYFSQVVGSPLRNSTAINYFHAGLDMASALSPDHKEVLQVEQEAHWVLGGRDYIGYIDLVQRDAAGITILDHKSRDLKPRSNRKRHTKTDQELDEYLRQLYLYAIPVMEMYGEYPSFLQFNCYRTGVQIKEPFCKRDFERTKQWAIERANEIEQNDDWSPTMDFFGCRYLCDVNSECEYYHAGR